MSRLTDLRAEHKAALEAEDATAAFPILNDVTVTTEYPERIIAPAIIIHPSDPYLTEEGQTYGHLGVNLVASLITSTGDNATVTDQLDDLIEATCAALDITSISEPFTFTWLDTKYLAVNAAIATTSINFGG